MLSSPALSAPSRDASLAAALSHAQSRYREANPKSAEAQEKASAFMPGGNTRTSLWAEPFPLCIASGEGSRIRDVDGHVYVDFLGEFTAGIFGHSSAVLAAAVGEAHSRGINLSSHNTDEARLAELIAGRFASIELLRFANSGTEANLMALAVAKAFTKRERILVFRNGYHGGVLTFTQAASPANVPHDFLVLPYDDVEAAKAAFADHGPKLAAVLVEPMQGAGGCRPASPDFFEALRRGADETGAVLIFDEIQTSRLSFGGFQALCGVTPDMTTLGKFFGGGLAFGCFGGRREIMDLLDPRRPGAMAHAGTFNNNTLAMAAGIAAIETYLTPEKLDALNARGEGLREALNAAFARRHAPYRATGIGSLMNIHGVAEGSARPQLVRLMQLELAEAGHYFAARGLIALSLPLSQAEIEAFLAAVDTFLERHAALWIPNHGPGDDLTGILDRAE